MMSTAITYPPGDVDETVALVFIGPSLRWPRRTRQGLRPCSIRRAWPPGCGRR